MGSDDFATRSTGPLEVPGSFEEGGFAPGAILANRYRIVGLLGRGGMGEVYRADDLMLASLLSRIGRLPKDKAVEITQQICAGLAAAHDRGVSRVLGAPHTVDMMREWILFSAALAFALLWAAWSWTFYMAVEPFVRRRRPQSLISWSRLLAGRFRDPLVGRDLLLLGAVFGIVANLSWAWAVWPWSGWAPPPLTWSMP